MGSRNKWCKVVIILGHKHIYYWEVGNSGLGLVSRKYGWNGFFAKTKKPKFKVLGISAHMRGS